jgi:NADH dehydrogenase
MILVTGATGFVGRSVVNRLEQAGQPFKVYTGRINDPLSLRAELLDVETVIHLAGSEARGSIRALQHVDIDGTQRLIEESQRMTVTRLIFLSRLEADPHAYYPLLRAKGEAERLIQRSGIPFTIIRSATLYGRDDHFLNAIANLAAWSWPLVWLPGGGENPMQPLWVEDLARCLVKTLDRPDLEGETVSLAGGELLRYKDIVTAVLQATGMWRIPLKSPLLAVRPLAFLTFSWRARPLVSRFFMDRFSLPEAIRLDSVRRRFGFNPSRLQHNIAYLRRPWWQRR